MSERANNDNGEQMLRTDRCKNLPVAEGVQRCDNCERFREDKGLGDFVCCHVRGYKEAPSHIKRCFDCECWRSDNEITSDFWCKHNKFHKAEWDRDQEW